MTWSRFDDAARKHPKAVMAGNEAWGFWCAAIMYSNQYGTDGFVPDAALATELLPQPITKAKARKLSEVCCVATVVPDGPGLFVRDDVRGGYVIHDFLDWNPSKAEVESKRKADRDRKRRPTESAPESARPPPVIPNGIPNGSATDSEGSRASARALPARPAQPIPSRPAVFEPATAAAPARISRNLEEALLEPICSRAERVGRNPTEASYLQPHRWPEVQRVSDALCEAMGRPARVLADYARDSGVRAVVALYAAGYAPGDLERAASLAPKQEWWTKDGARRGLSTLTPEVVDRALHDPGDGRVGELVRRAKAETDRELGPAPLAGLLPGALAAGGGGGGA